MDAVGGGGGVVVGVIVDGVDVNVVLGSVVVVVALVVVVIVVLVVVVVVVVALAVVVVVVREKESKAFAESHKVGVSLATSSVTSLIFSLRMFLPNRTDGWVREISFPNDDLT